MGRGEALGLSITTETHSCRAQAQVPVPAPPHDAVWPIVRNCTKLAIQAVAKAVCDGVTVLALLHGFKRQTGSRNNT